MGSMDEDEDEDYMFHAGMWVNILIVLTSLSSISSREPI